MNYPTPRPFAEVPQDATPYAVQMRDGIRLATDIYLPKRGVRWPVLLSRLPYDKAGDECFMPSIARWFNERGYAVVVQDVRGKVRSDGALEPFRHELADGYDTIDWIDHQTWSTGDVGMFGDSYFGWTQWAAAASRHPALRAITPRVISADAAHLVSRQGVFLQEVCALWTLETWLDDSLYDYEDQLDWSIRPLTEVVPARLGGRRSPFLDALARGRLDPAARLPVRGDVPALHLGGWWDFLHRGQLATWREAGQAGRSPQFLRMDVVDHGWNYLREPGQPFVEPRTDAACMEAFLEAYLQPLLPFLDAFVRGKGQYDVPPVQWRLAGDSWHASETWPPRESRPVEWFLTGSPAGGRAGGLGTQPDRSAATVRWVHDPSAPVPSRGHPYHPLIEPVDESAGPARDDVLVFETDPAGAPLDLAGSASLEMSVRSSAPSTHVMARLSDVAPDGTAFAVLAGATVANASQGQLGVDLGSTGYRIHPGHRLRLELSSSEFPRYVVHPGSDADPWTTHDCRPSQQQLTVGGPRGARLRCFALPEPGRTS